jgi:hypothetical protein
VAVVEYPTKTWTSSLSLPMHCGEGAHSRQPVGGHEAVADGHSRGFLLEGDAGVAHFLLGVE